MSKILETDLCRINYSNSLEELANATVNLYKIRLLNIKNYLILNLMNRLL